MPVNQIRELSYILYAPIDLVDHMKNQTHFEFKEGQMVAYIPNHCDGNIFHSDVEYGIISQIRNGHIFVKYFDGIIRHGRNCTAKNTKPINLLKLDAEGIGNGKH